MKVGDLVGFRSANYKEIGIVTRVLGEGHTFARDSYVEIVVGSWKGPIRSTRLKVINEGRYSCNSTKSPSVAIPNTVRKP